MIMKILLTVISCAFIAIATAIEIRPATLRLFKGSWKNYIETPIDDLTNMYPHIDKEKNITIYTSGYGHRLNDSAVRNVMLAFIERNITNPMLIYWEDESRGLLLPNIRVPALATVTARRIAAKLGEALANLIEDINFSPNKIQLYGASLGAHLVGWMGRKIQKRNYNVSRIYGLDPARPAFDFSLALDGLNPSDGQLVIGLHTNAGGHGICESVGSIDFWVNCDNDGLQPGCFKEHDLKLDVMDICNHERAWLLAIEAHLHPNAFPAIRAKSCANWMFKTPTNSVINYYGENTDPSKEGNFYFSTYSAYPFSKRRNSIRVN